MNYDFSNMKGKARKLYTKMWGKTDFGTDFITNKNWIGEETNSSFYLNTPKTAKLFKDIIPVLAEEVAEKFAVRLNQELFQEKFKQACSGSGQEAMKITTMHSSSLCALLFFYNVCEGNELVLRLGNDDNENTYVFNQSFFEFQNVVIKGRQPSNMDVTLVGYKKDVPTKPVVLFLESKFSEYYAEPKDKLDIADSYLKNQYGEVIYKNKLQEIGYKIDDTIAPESKFRLLAPVATYMEGIKQMVSHYIGVRNLLTGEVVKKRADDKEYNKVVTLVENGATVLLGSVIFDDLFEKVEVKKKYYGAYEEAYIKLAKVLNEVSKGVEDVAGTERLTVLEVPLTYTEIFDKEKIGESEKGFQLDEKVKNYYFGKKKRQILALLHDKIKL